MKTKRILVISDLHCGSVWGICPPEVQIEGGGIYHHSKYQRWLWECWQDMLASVKRLGRPVLVLNGDAIQGNSPRDGELIGSELSVQQHIAEELLRPLVALCSRFYMIRGTPWHEGKVAEHTETLGRNLGAEKKRGTGQYNRVELYLSLDGLVVHFNHHIGMSSVPDYEATMPRREMRMLLAELMGEFGSETPNVRLVVRSHRHRHVHIGTPATVQATVTPAWQLKTEYGYKNVPSLLPHIGYTVITRTNLGLQVDPHLYPLLPPHVEEV